MNREEIIKKIEELENRKFYLNMKDFWELEDYTKNNKIMNEIISLKNQLKEIENRIM